MEKCPKTLYLKEFEQEKIENLVKKINDKRVKNEKKPFKTAFLIHEFLAAGISKFENDFN